MKRDSGWDQRHVNQIRGPKARKRTKARFAVCAVVGLIVALMPSGVQAHLGPPGINDAQLDVSHEFTFIAGTLADHRTVKGTNFTAYTVAQIFQCRAGETDLQRNCVGIGSSPVDGGGNFAEVTVPVSSRFVSVSGAVTECASWTPTQCAVVAATYAVNLEATSMAEHNICFQGPEPCSLGSVPTTTTTTRPSVPEWEPAPSMRVPRQNLAAAVGADGRIYVVGGNTSEGEALDSAEVFNACTKKWSPLPPMPQARTELAAATGSDGRIYAIGGRDEYDGRPLGTVDAYDPATNSWSTVASLAVPRANLAGASGSDGRVYAIGGAVSIAGVERNPVDDADTSEVTHGYPVPTVEVFDESSNAWHPVTPLPTPRKHLAAATAGDGRTYAIAGEHPWMTQNRLPRRPVDAYTPGPAGTPGAWQSAASFHLLPKNPAVTAGPDGRLYAAGGSGSDLRGLRTTNVYDPGSNGWTAYPEALSTPRHFHATAAGPDGRIYAIGGNDGREHAWDAKSMSSVEALKVGPDNCPPGPPPPADFDGNFATDVSVFRPSSGTWFVKDGLTLNYGTEGDIPVPGDYDGDRKADVAVFRPSNGVWFVRNSSGGDTAVGYGTDGDIPVPADYDGDGKADMAVFRPSNGVWFIKYSAGGDAAVAWGTSGDVAVPADYDGDDKADFAVFRNGTWFIRPASGAADITVNYGTTGDIPVPADYDADGVADIGVFRPSSGVWYLTHSGDDQTEAFAFGTEGDIPVTGDYNADGIADPAVFRPDNGVWYVETGEVVAWGAGSDIPLPLAPAVRLAYFP